PGRATPAFLRPGAADQAPARAAARHSAAAYADGRDTGDDPRGDPAHPGGYAAPRSRPLQRRSAARHRGGARMTSVRITGVGAELPPRVVTSAEVEQRADIRRLGLAPGWLERVTRARGRTWAQPDAPPTDLPSAPGP